MKNDEPRADSAEPRAPHHRVHRRQPASFRKSIFVNLPAIMMLAGACGALSLRTGRVTAAEAISDADGSAESSAGMACAVKVLTKREGENTHFYVINQELCEVTMTFEMMLVNLHSDQALPLTTTLPPGQTTEVFTLSPAQAEAKWCYDYTNYYKLGSACAEHDDSHTYQLPYAPGNKFKVTQGYNGSFSHRGANKYSIDWKMPEGTQVRAARGGVVVRVKDDSSMGGPSLKYDRYNNFILIRHDDGTLGHYCHLQKDSGIVQVGQRVAMGDVIARSGSTGFSSGPHLHFCVFRNKNGRERESLPVKFRTATQNAITLIEGQSYRAADVLQSADTLVKANGG